ncbi:MAG TPA: hypothetical protein VM734_32755, partial [Kofleriaceae bacterium]|nr:hypothetical protein [Kofleriaceae bacterium]
GLVPLEHREHRGRDLAVGPGVHRRQEDGVGPAVEAVGGLERAVELADQPLEAQRQLALLIDRPAGVADLLLEGDARAAAPAPRIARTMTIRFTRRRA